MAGSTPEERARKCYAVADDTRANENERAAAAARGDKICRTHGLDPAAMRSFSGTSGTSASPNAFRTSYGTNTPSGGYRRREADPFSGRPNYGSADAGTFDAEAFRDAVNRMHETANAERARRSAKNSSQAAIIEKVLRTSIKSHRFGRIVGGTYDDLRLLQIAGMVDRIFATGGSWPRAAFLNDNGNRAVEDLLRQ